MDWSAMTKASRAAFGQSVNDWIVASSLASWARGLFRPSHHPTFPSVRSS
jgi:hypothetical protein